MLRETETERVREREKGREGRRDKRRETGREQRRKGWREGEKKGKQATTHTHTPHDKIERMALSVFRKLLKEPTSQELSTLEGSPKYFLLSERTSAQEAAKTFLIRLCPLWSDCIPHHPKLCY